MYTAVRTGTTRIRIGDYDYLFEFLRQHFFNTAFATSASVLTLERVFNPGAENPSFRLCARHVTLPETSRGATAGQRLKSEQSPKGFRVIAVTRH